MEIEVTDRQGNLIGHKKEYNDKLLLELAKADLPGQFTDNRKQNGSQVNIQILTFKQTQDHLEGQGITIDQGQGIEDSSESAVSVRISNNPMTEAKPIANVENSVTDE